MSELSIAERRSIIEGALSVLHHDALALKLEGQTVLQEIRNAIEATLGDNRRPDAVTRLLLAMAEQSIAEMEKLGMNPGDFDFRQMLGPRSA